MRNTAKESFYLKGGSKAFLKKFKKLPGYFKSQNGEVKITKKKNGENE